MKSLGDILNVSIQYLKERQIDRPRRCAEELLASVLKIKRLDLYMQFDRPLQEQELQLYREFLKRKVKGEPLEYILEEIDFYHCRICVTPDVLIPRQETEILLDKICARLRACDPKNKVVWDICCGAGCLAIGLKKALPDLQVTASDISPKALEVCKKNCKLNDVHVSLVQGDLLAPFAGAKADVVVCNPPYISEAEYTVLDKDVKDFEPHGALVGGPTGLEFYARLAADLPQYLNPGAKIFFEIGTGQGNGVKSIFNASYWIIKEVERDWAGHERFFFLEIE